VTFFTEMKPVVAPQHDDGVLGVRAFGQGVQDGADAVVDKTNRCQVSLGQGALLVLFDNFIVGGCH